MTAQNWFKYADMVFDQDVVPVFNSYHVLVAIEVVNMSPCDRLMKTSVPTQIKDLLTTARFQDSGNVVINEVAPSASNPYCQKEISNKKPYSG